MQLNCHRQDCTHCVQGGVGLHYHCWCFLGDHCISSVELSFGAGVQYSKLGTFASVHENLLSEKQVKDFHVTETCTRPKNSKPVLLSNGNALYAGLFQYLSLLFLMAKQHCCFQMRVQLLSL